MADRHLLHHPDNFVTGFTKGPDDFLYLTSGYGDAVSIYRIEMASSSRDPGGAGEGSSQAGPAGGVLPGKLSATRIFPALRDRTDDNRATRFQPAYPIWKNGTRGSRFVVLPTDAKIDTSDPKNWRFPHGTHLVKHLALQKGEGGVAARRNIETQVLHKTRDGWVAGAYLWNEQGTDAELVLGRPVSRQLRMAQSPHGVTAYTVLTQSQCFTCHSREDAAVIGLAAEQLDQPQLDTLFDSGKLTHRVVSANYGTGEDPESRARAYFHGNCAFCHSGDALGQVLGFSLAHEEISTLAGKRSTRTNRALITPGNPQQSQLYNMLAWQQGYAPMPPLGRDFPDSEGLATVREWIEGPVANSADWAVEAGSGALQHPPASIGDGGKSAKVDLSGIVRTDAGEAICAVVMAARELTYSCNPEGSFAFEDVSLGETGAVERHVYAQGFYPRTDRLFESTDEAVILQRVGACPDYNPAGDAGADPRSAGKTVTLNGRLVLPDGQPVGEALVVANGRHTFSAKNSGEFSLELRLDSRGQVALQVFSEDTAPFVRTLTADAGPILAQLRPLSECR